MRIGWNGGGHHTRLESIRDEARRAAADESAGATDLRVNALCPTTEEAERTRAFLRGLCAEKNHP